MTEQLSLSAPTMATPKHQPAQDERSAPKPSAAVVLRMLRACGESGVTTGAFLAAYCGAASQRMGELKRMGYVIRRERIPGRHTYRYTLVSEP